MRRVADAHRNTALSASYERKAMIAQMLLELARGGELGGRQEGTQNDQQ